MNTTPDAIVIGAGPNGLVAANRLADEGWSVVVLEAQPDPGGAVRSGELIEPGFINDHCSAFYPLGAGSPVMKALELEKHGLVWRHAPLVLAHPALDGTCPVLSRDLDETATSLEQYGDGDGEAWRAMFELWRVKGDDLLDTLFRPFPPVKGAARLARSTAWQELIRFARFAVLPVRRLGEEQFEADPARRLMAGLALHADLLPESNLSGFYGWLLAALGQSVGFPSPEGGAGQLTAAMVRRLESLGGRVQCNAPVARIAIEKGKAVGVHMNDGTFVRAGKAVLADVAAPHLYKSMIGVDHLPPGVQRDIDRFHWDSATVKVDWNLDAPIPWSADDAKRAGTVHIADSVDELSITSSELARGLTPQKPFILLGQQSMADRTRQPEGKETVWAYTHIPFSPRGDATDGGPMWSQEDSERHATAMEERIEALAPGFRDLVRGRFVAGPPQFESDNANLVHGALGGGTAQLHQQLVFRPVPGLARPETPVENLYLASSSAHPGGGVHGACGANAAQAAMAGSVRKTFVKAVRWAGEVQSRNKARIVP